MTLLFDVCRFPAAFVRETERLTGALTPRADGSALVVAAGLKKCGCRWLHVGIGFLLPLSHQMLDLRVECLFYGIKMSVGAACMASLLGFIDREAGDLRKVNHLGMPLEKLDFVVR